jgi:transcriptional regulator with XRE-family HTH domain
MKSWLELYEEESRENQVLMEKERLALEVAIALGEAMEKAGMTKAEFARALGKSKGYVTRVLQGSYNLTLGTIAELALGLNVRARMNLIPLRQRIRTGKVLQFTSPFQAQPPKLRPGEWDAYPEGGEALIVTQDLGMTG